MSEQEKEVLENIIEELEEESKEETVAYTKEAAEYKQGTKAAGRRHTLRTHTALIELQGFLRA